MIRLHFTDIKSHILSQLNAAQKEILVAVSWLTDREQFGALLSKLDAGVKVSLITRNDYLNNHENALDWKQFTDAGGELRFCKPGKMLHYKFAVIDRTTAIATSQNWTCFAGDNNRENILVISEPATVKNFVEEFDLLCSEFPKETNPPRISKEQINEKLHGFYELTLHDDEKFQRV